MKSVLLGLALILSILSPALAGGVRIGFVDMPRLFAEYPGTKAALVRYEAVAREKERQLAAEEKDLKARKAEHARRKESMDAKALQAAEKGLAKRTRELDQRKRDYLDEMKDREDRMSKAVVEEIRERVARLAEKKKLDLVLDREKAVYAKDAVDLTPELLASFKTVEPKDEP